MNDFIDYNISVLENGQKCVSCGASVNENNHSIAFVHEYVICLHCGSVVGKRKESKDERQEKSIV